MGENPPLLQMLAFLYDYPVLVDLHNETFAFVAWRLVFYDLSYSSASNHVELIITKLLCILHILMSVTGKQDDLPMFFTQNLPQLFVLDNPSLQSRAIQGMLKRLMDKYKSRAFGFGRACRLIVKPL